MDNFENILRPGFEPSMTKIWRPAVVLKQDSYLTPQSLQNYVLKSEKVHKLIEFYSKKLEKNPKVIHAEVKEILAEIGLDRSEMVIRMCGVVITAMAKRITKGIYINKLHIERIRGQLGKCPVLYLPSHRSYLDFILMSYVCFHYDIEIPGIAAGMGESSFSSLKFPFPLELNSSLRYVNECFSFVFTLHIPRHYRFLIIVFSSKFLIL